MAKKYWEGAYDINTDWGGDESTDNLPLPGSAVQKVIKDEFKKKVGYLHEDTIEGKVYFYPTEDSYNKGETPIGSVVSTARYSMEIKGDVNNKNVLLSTDSNKEFVWYFRTLEIATKNVYNENITVEYIINNESEGRENRFSTSIEAEPDITNDGYTKVVLDLDKYLTNGTSLITINIKGLKTKQENGLNNRISIIMLDMEDNTNFSTLFKENFISLTNVTCTIGQKYFYEYRIDENGDFILDKTDRIGSGKKEQVQNFVNLSDLNIADGKHVFEYRLFVKLDNDTEPYYTRTQRIEFIKGNLNTKFEEPQILIYTSYANDEEYKAEDGNIIINGVSQYIPYTMKYAVYNTSEGSTNVEFYEIIEDKETIPVTNTVTNDNFGEYNVQLLESGLKKIKILTKDVEDIVTNGNGRIIYLNVKPSTLSIDIYNNNLRVDFSSVGKNNDSVDRNVWVSNINESGARFENHAVFNENFDWSQGWTENGLVISEGSEVTFDYIPFPQQKAGASTEESNEYVGGYKGYTFEIEFMTQNVTNENAVVCDMMDEIGGNCGLQITGSEIRFTTPNNKSVSTRFKAEEMNRATIVIRPQKSSANAFKGLVELYVNGVLSNIAKYDENEKFEIFKVNDEGKAISKNLTIKGVEGADIVVKYIRAYNGTMEPDDVVNNYILFRTDGRKMINLYDKNNVINNKGIITPQSMLEIGNIPFIIFVGRTIESELASGDGNGDGYDGNPDIYPGGYIPGSIGANEDNWYGTLEGTSDKKKKVDMDVIYYNPLDKTKNFKFVKAYITPQGTSSMYYPKKNYRIYTQKNKDTRCFFSSEEAGILEYDDMKKWDFGEKPEDRVYEKWRGKNNYKKRKYSFKDNAQAVKCWCLKADFAETSSSHNTGIARLWGDTLKNSTVKLSNEEKPVFKTNAQATTEVNYNNNINGDMPDVRTTIDGFPIVVFGAKSYSDDIVFLGQYNFNNDKSTESVFGFCDIDDKHELTDNGKDTDTGKESKVVHTLDDMLDKYMSCVETLDNGNILANFAATEFVDASGNTISWDDSWEQAFEFRYPEIPEKPKESDYKDSNENWVEGGEEEYNKAYNEYKEEKEKWNNNHLKPFKHFAKWVYDCRWCDVDGNILPGLTEEEAMERKQKFATEKWDHLDVWKMAAYYIYTMRFGAVDQIVKNSMLTSEGPFAYNKEGNKYGYWDTTDITSENYGKYYKWYYINYDNDTIMGVKNDGSLAYGPEINRRMKEGEGLTASYIYAGHNSSLWNNFDYDEEFQEIVRIADQGISRTMTYKRAIDMFDVEQVGKWCERIYNKDADYKYISPYVADWKYDGDDEKAENFTDKLFMLQGSRTAHRRWWLSKRFNLFDGKWASGEFATKFVEVKCDYGAIGDTFGAVAGANAYFGYQINNNTFGGPEGGETTEYQSYENINWVLKKNIQIGDPIAIYGSTDMLELNLMGLSKNLSSVSFRFGTNSDIGNKLERLILSIPDDLLTTTSSYKIYTDDEIGTVNGQTAFEKLKEEYPDIKETDFEIGGKYPTSEKDYDASEENAPDFYRSPITKENGDIIYIYFRKIQGGVRNNACKDMSFNSLDKLQVLKMAGYNGISAINLSENKFINSLDIRYSKIGNVTFAEGARIKEFSASTSLTALTFDRCSNIKLSDIVIDSNPLSVNGGVFLKRIHVFDSDGLNHDTKFKDFILNWIKGNSVVNKSLELKGIRWKGITIKDIEALYSFYNKAVGCTLSGVIEMANVNLSQADITFINNFKNEPGIDLTFKYSTNILLNCPDTIVAGKVTMINTTVLPSKEEIIESGGNVRFSFVKEVPSDYETNLINPNTGKRYIEISGEDIRGGSVTLNVNPEDEFSAILTPGEIIYKEDTKILIAAILVIDSISKFDVVQITIKDPTYATKGSISGLISLNEMGKKYDYKLSLLTDDNLEPIGSRTIEWQIDGKTENDLKYVATSAISEDGKILTITTDENETPEKVASITINAKVTNGDINKTELYFSKEVRILNKDIIMTDLTNKVILDICNKNGLTKDPNGDAMTKQEAAEVTNISTFFSNITAECSFDEFAFFNNPNLKLEEGAFKNSKIKSITIPETITELSKSLFEGCDILENVILSKNTKGSIPEKTFMGCSSLKEFRLPNGIKTIGKFAFGNCGIEVIAFDDVDKVDTQKVIYIAKDCELERIINDAFEVSNIVNGVEKGWYVSGDVKSTNVLREISLPQSLSLELGTATNFLLSANLNKINLLPEEYNQNIIFENNILYPNSNKDIIIRALPNNYKGVIIEELDLSRVTLIDNYAFYKCSSIRKITTGYELAKNGLGMGAFFESSINEIDLSPSTQLANLDDYTFYRCSNLSKLTLPGDEGSLNSLGVNLFVSIPNLKELILPNTITKCKNVKNSYIFDNCSIESLTIPDSLLYVSDYFINTCSIKSLIFPKHFNLATIKDKAILSCSALTEVYLPLFSTTVSDDSWFVYNGERTCDGPFSSEEDAKIIEGRLNRVEDSTNYTTKKVTANSTIVINADLYKRGYGNEGIFDCGNISEFKLHELDDNQIMIADIVDNKSVAIYKISDIDNKNGINTIIPTSSKTLKIVAKNLENYKVLEGTSSIDAAFYLCKKLVSCSIPEGLVTLLRSSFEECENLKEIILPSTLESIVERAFFNNEKLERVEILSEKLNLIDDFSFVGCSSLYEILIRSLKTPTIDVVENNKDENNGYVKFHPFGFRSGNFVGANTKDSGKNKLYVPFKNDGGYETNKLWLIPLQKGADKDGNQIDESPCGFKLEYIKLYNTGVTIEGPNINNQEIIYLKSERDEFKNDGKVESYTPFEGEFNTVDFNGKVYDNETIYIYSDPDCTELIGEFVAKYGKNKYIIVDNNQEILGATQIYKNISVQNVFEDDVVLKENEEMANITKKDYEILQSKINQLMKLLNKKK